MATGFSGASANAGSLGNFNEFDGQGGNDIITGNGNTQIVYGSATAGVTVNLAAGTAVGNASVGTDTILGGVSRVLGSDFNDTLIGNEFNNVLNGQGGNDIIDGAAGTDTLTGGGGTDTFVFADGFGFDTITDFNQAQADKIDLTGVTTVTDFATLQNLATQSGANTVIDFGSGNVLTLNNVTLANLTAK
ncbi:MAG: type I secretion C-terminal target domain-containing protein [Pseudomonadota bacterium]